MYRGVVQDLQFQTDYLKDYIAKHQLELPVGKGRIWRVVHDSTHRDRKPQLSKESSASLVGTLSHPNGWWRDMAQQLIVQRGDRAVVPALKELARTAPDPRTRLHALWTLDGLDAIDVDSVALALKQDRAELRAAGIRLAERWLGQPDNPLHAAVLARIDDASWIVRRQLAASLGSLPAAERGDPISTMIARYGDDAITVDAAISGIRGQESDVLAKLLENARAGSRALDAISMLAGAVTKSGDRTGVQQIVAGAVDTARGEPQRLALLRGLDAGLNGAVRTTGGIDAASGPAAAAGPAIPGARGNGRGGRGTRTPVPIFSEEPKALTAIAAGSGEMAELATQILERASWPGKPAPARPPVAPLTDAEQARYTAGGEIYNNICVACHQPDGHGKEKLAPSLVGSPFALANPTIPVRILLAGKEGAVGLMPPLSALTDEQIAAVLTYIRRSWGNEASAVDAPIVKEVRGLTQSHARPWTEPELLKLMNGRGGG
jgi:mono/diheme cytochrome c family protein